MKKYLSVLIIIISMGMTQDITNKLGGNTASETYEITDSNDNVLMKVQGDGPVTITGLVTMQSFMCLDDGSQSVNTGDTINPTTSYMKVTSVAPTHITLSTTTAISNGSEVGQILFIENQNGSYNLIIPNNANTGLGTDRTLSPYQILHLIWSGTDWVMPNI